jgi:EAL domain-containing protein (putative c-di-GMP-specific phosphodiesterase class I)
VEHEDQRAFLQQHGCNEYQGFLYSRPLPADEFAALLTSQTSRGSNPGLPTLRRVV